MAKTFQQNSKKDRSRDDSIFDAGSTIESSGLFGQASAFIPTLTFLSGPAIGKEVPLISRELVLGRGTECDIMIADPSVSRKHLQICCRKVVRSGEASQLKIVARDLGSRNGTLINYVPLRSAVLKPGDKIILGRVILKYDHRDVAEQSFFDEIYRLATCDSLTTLLNKSTITRVLVEELAANKRSRRWVSVILGDVDEFKSLNDLYGHLLGDRILQSIAELFKSNLRRKDKAGRFGGDEFLLVLPETGPKGAFQVAERIRAKLQIQVKADLGLFTGVTVSMGIASCRTDETDPETLLECADRALYRAKSLGRNRVEVWKRSAGALKCRESR